MRAAKAEKAVPAEGGSGKTPRRRFWTGKEEEDLVRGVAKYGKGCWKKILEDENFAFNNRTSTDLKDKWRNLSPAAIARHQQAIAAEDADRRAQKKRGKEAEVEADEQVDDESDQEDLTVKKRVKEEPGSIRKKAIAARNERLGL